MSPPPPADTDFGTDSGQGEIVCALEFLLLTRTNLRNAQCEDRDN